MTAPWLRGRILFIADADALADRLFPLVGACLEGGVKMVQLRGKNLTDQEFYSQARTLREVTTAAGALLFINNRLDIALAAGADGVHLGQEDLPLDAARHLLPVGILGSTCRNQQQAQQAERQCVDYVAVGAIFPSPSKPSAPVVGLESLRQVRAAVSLPICAIGGINSHNLSEVLRAGADFVAVISAITQAQEAAEAAASLVKLGEAAEA